MKMISECPMFEKGGIILEILVSELGVVDQISNKEAGN